MEKFRRRCYNKEYKSKRIQNKAINEEYVYDGDACLDDILPLFLTKGLDWKYEKEWRIIYTKKQMYDINEDELYRGNLKFPCVSGIYFGYRTHPEIHKNIIEICKCMSDNHKCISIYQAKLAGESYKIIFERLDS